MPHTLHLVDYCAYKKPTHIWTNLEWNPQGTTQTGRCNNRCEGGNWGPSGRWVHQHACDSAAELAISPGARQASSQGSSSYDAAPRDNEGTSNHHEATNDTVTSRLTAPVTDATIYDIDHDKDSSKKRKRHTCTVAVGSKITRQENPVPQDGDLIDSPSKRKSTRTPVSKKICSDSTVM